MKSFVKILVITLLSIILLVAAAIAVVTLIIDPNDYKDQITGAVKDRTGRELSIPGDISWSFFPWLGVELGEARLGNASGFKPDTFAAVRKVEVRVQLWPLLIGNLEVGRIVLDGLEVTLQRNAAGRSNWADLMQPAAQSKETPPPSESKTGPSPLASLAVAGLEVRQARILWDDQAAGQYLELNPLNLHLGRLAPGVPVPVTADFLLQSRQPQAQAGGNITLQVTFNLERQQVLIEKLSFDGEVNSTQLPTEQAQFKLDAPRLLVNLANQTADAGGLTFETMGLKLKTDIQASQILQSPRYQASVSLDPFSPRKVLEKLAIEPPATADPRALQNTQLSAKLQGDLQGLKVSDLFMQFDQSELSGQLDIPRFNPPAIRYDLALNQIDVDRYLPPPPDEPKSKTGGSKTVATPATAAGTSASLIPVEVIRPLDLEGTLRIDRLKAMNLHSQAIRITARARDGRVRLHPLGAQLYEGSYSGDIKLDMTGATPRLNLNESLKQVRIGPLLKDLWGDDVVRGRTDLSLDLSARGNDPESIRKTLGGNTRFEVRDAEVKDIDMAQLQKVVDEIDTDIKAIIDAGNLAKAGVQMEQLKQKFNAIKNPQANNASYFSSITGTAQIKDGIARNNDLRARLPFGRVRGEGSVDLVRLYSDYTTSIKLTSRGEVDSGKTYEQMDKTPFKIHFKGPLDSLKPQLDFSDYLHSESRKALDEAEAKAKAKLKKKADEKIEQEKDKLKQKLEDEAGDLLKKLFK
ncbi:MAG: AsmA family protein [Thiohalophilus sp.]|jgi:AsmA protein